jgi:hypothetical protein
MFDGSICGGNDEIGASDAAKIIDLNYSID